MLSDSLTRTLVTADAVLFDFDGPLCDVYAGMPAPGVAGDLARLAAKHEPALRARLAEISDPLEVLRLTYEADQSLSSRIEQALISAELKAVQVAGSPTRGGVDALATIKRSGRPIAVVTNNSPECVHSFLGLHGLSDLVDEVVGRVPHRPDLMKPNPDAVLRAARRLGVPPAACVLIGDSLADIQAAHAAGGAVVGYVNKPHKLHLFTEAGADVIIVDMRAIAHALASDVDV